MQKIFSPKVQISLGVLIVVVAASAYWLKYLHPFETTDNAYLKAHISLISSKETGYVKQVLFTDNQKVNAGDLLVVIDNEDFQAKVRQATAQIQAETSHIRTLTANKNTQHAIVQQQQAELQVAAAELQKVSKDVLRFADLAADGAVSVQTHDNSLAGHKQAQAHHDKVRAELAEAENGLLSIDAQINEANAHIQVAETELQLANIALANTHIVAPMSGIVGNRSVQQGQLMRPGSVLAYLIPDSEIYLEANFKETQLTDMRIGQAVSIMVDAYPDQTFQGVIDSFAPASGSEFSLLPSENATGNFTKIVRRVPVKINFAAGSDLSKLKPGLSVLAKVTVR